MIDKKIKVGSLIVNSGGAYAKVLKITADVHFCSKLVEDPAVAREADEKAINFRFNSHSAKMCGIKLASEGGKDADLDGDKTQEEIAKEEADAKAKADADAKAKADADAEKSDYKVLKGVEFPKGTAHAEGAVIQLTKEEASEFVDGLIEKVKKGFFNRG